MSRIFRFLVYNSLTVSLGASVLPLHFFIATELQISWEWLVFSGLSTYVAYNLQRLLKDTWTTENDQKKWIDQNRKYIIFLIFAAAVICLLCVLKMQLVTLSLILILSAISLFYTGKWAKRVKNLREIPFIKIYLIAFSWASLSVLLPAFEYLNLPDKKTLILFIIHFLFILAITIPFDIRDMNLDQTKQRTLPQILGFKGAKVLSVGLLMTSCVIYAISFPIFNYALLLVYLIYLVLILKTKRKNHAYYEAGWIDGGIFIYGISPYINW